MQLEYDSKQILDNFPSICRFCLSQEGCVPILDDGQIAEQLLPATEFILAKVDESDGLPNSICQRCLKCVVEFAELEARCQQTYAILNQLLDGQSDEANVEQPVVTVIQEPQIPVICIEDDEQEQENDDDEQEQEQEREMDNELDQDLEELEEEEPDLNMKPIKVLISEQTRTYKKAQQCPICGKIVAQLVKHLPVHSKTNRFACPDCPKRFKHSSTLKQHVNSIHLRLKQFYCPIEGCKEGFTDRTSLKYHVTVNHRNARDYVCPECGKAFHTTTGLIQHRRLAHEQRKYRCDICGKIFALNHHLKEHMRTHSEERPFSCNLCDRSFKQMKNLTEHIAVRHGQPRKRKEQTNASDSSDLNQ